MKKEVVASGLLGGTVMFVWLFVTNAVLPFKSNIIHRMIPLVNQLVVHEALRENIREPGTYSVPYLSNEDEARFPDYRSQPVYSITYEGYSHGGSGGSIMSSFPVMVLAVFIPPLLAAWMLSVTSSAILSTYLRRFLFVTVLGLIVALHDDVVQMSLGPQPEDYLIFLATNNVIAWALTGLVIARGVRPAKI